MQSDFSKGVTLRLLILATLLLVGTLAGLSLYSRALFEPEMAPELEKKALRVAAYINGQVQRAVEWGVPLSQLEGMIDLFADAQSDNKDVLYLAVTDRQGRALHFRGPGDLNAATAFVPAAIAFVAGDASTLVADAFTNIAAPVMKGDEVVGLLHVGVAADYAAQQMREVYYDLAMILLVSLLFTFEILLYFVSVAVARPLSEFSQVAQNAAAGDFSLAMNDGGRDEIGRIAVRVNQALARLRDQYDQIAAAALSAPAATRAAGEAALTRLRERYRFPSSEGSAPGMQGAGLIRIAVFVFSLAEELTRTFLSVYIKDLFDPTPGLTMELVIGAPIALFMLLWALAQPLAGVYSERFGRRKVFMVGAVLSAVGLLGAGLSINLWYLILARCVTAVGYAMVFISSQGMVIDNTPREGRAKGMAMYAGGILTAGVCGPAIGGILADQIGFRATFVLSAGLALLAALVVQRLLVERPDRARAAELRLRDFGVFARNPRFLGLVLFSAIPTKMALTGLIFFLIPLYLNDQGISQSMIGRVLLLYWLAMIFIAPAAGGLSDRLGNRRGFVVLGGALAAMAGIIAVLIPSIYAVAAGVVVLGIAHGVVMTPQLALVSIVCREESAHFGETTVLAMFRLLERVGNVVAPFIAGILLANFGYDGAIVGIGYILAACVVR